MKRKASVLTFTVVLVVLLLLVASVPSLKADTGEPQLLWEKTYGAVVGNAVVQTSDGGYAVAGYSAVPSIGGSYANRTFLLVKTEAVGTLQWRKTYGVEGEFDSIAYSVIQTNDGGYALAGIRWTINNLFFWFVKTDSEGKMEWNRTYAGPVLNGFCVVIQTHDEGYALAGWTSNSSGRFLNLIKINQVGDVEWDKSYEGEQYDAIYAILETADGYGLAGRGQGDFLLVKTDLLGNIQWNKTYGGTMAEQAYSVVNTRDGGYLLAGTTESFATGTTNHNVDMDGWLVKTDSLGRKEWDLVCGSLEKDSLVSAVQTNDESYVAAGGSGSFALIVKADDSGHLKNQSTYLGLGESSANYVVETDDGNYTFTGQTGRSNSDFNVWLVKVTIPSSNQEIATPPSASPKLFWTTWIMVAVITGIVVGIGLIVYFKKRKH